MQMTQVFKSALDFQFPSYQGKEVVPCTFSSLWKPELIDLELRREFYDAGDSTGTYLHVDFCALYIVRSGGGIHQIDGIPFGITRGDVYLLPPGTTHSYNDYKQLEIDAFYFPLSLWSDKELEALRDISGFWQLFVDKGLRRLHLRPEIHANIEEAIREMRAEASRKELATPILLRALLFRFLATLARVGITEANDNLSLADVPYTGEALQLTELISWCEANIDRDISVAQMAGRMFLSIAHFSRLWKREFGVPPATYLRRLKLERARDLLENSNANITHIAHEVGFENLAHFSRCFKNCYGVSPQQFRRTASRLR